MDEDPLNDVKRQLREVRKTADEASKQSSAIATRLSSLTDLIMALDRKVRSAGGAAHIELPELSPDVIELCRVHFAIEVEAGHSTARALTKARNAKTDYQREFEDAVQAARRLARPNLLGWVLGTPKATWNTFVITAQRQRPLETLRQAELAHAEYTREQQALKERRPEADKAVTTVRQVVHDRLELALDREEVLPSWIHSSLGTYVHAKDDAWLNTAVDLVVYRLVFGVTARLHLFEVQISSDAQRKEHDRLKKECEKHRTA